MKNNLEDEIRDWLENGNLPKHDNYNDGDIRETARHFTEWEKEQLIEKACEWLKVNAGEHIYFDECDNEWYDAEELIEDFKQAMKKNEKGIN